MLKSHRRLARASHTRRRPTFKSLRGWLILSLLCSFAFTPDKSAFAQVRATPAGANSSCSRDTALALVQQQVETSKLIDDQVKRIAVLIRAADLLWVYRQERARAVFTEAFELAAANFKEKGDEPKRDGLALLVNTPDQRYVVINAVAKRDPSWAKKLTEQMLKQESEDAEAAATQNPQRDIRTAAKLLDLAATLLPSDAETAIAYARLSLRYPGSVELARFLYSFAKVNQAAADQFYREALAAYSTRPLSEFLYLSVYPFGNARTAGDMPVTASYAAPAGFVPNRSLQRSFLQVLLARAQRAVEGQSNEESFSGISGNGQLWMALTRLEPQVQQSTPDLADAVAQARVGLYGLLTQDSQRDVTNGVSNQDAAGAVTVSFNEQVDVASKERNPDRRDQIIASAILRAPESEELKPLLDAVENISDPNVRQQVRNWVYFTRAQSAAKERRFDEARSLASKIEELDQRTYLYAEIAKEMSGKVESQAQARELLDETLAAAAKAPDTVVTARALLAVAYLYAKIDPAQSLSVLGSAIASINRLDAPEFSRQSLVRRIEGKNFARYATFQTPDFSPETVFRELGKNDFDTAVSQANNIADRSLRSNMLLALADTCLRDAGQKEKEGPPKRKAKP